MTNFEFPYSKEEWINKYNMCVENYHKHTTWSNFFQIDSTTSLEQMIQKIDERHGTMLFSGEHGFQGEWLKVWDLCRQTNNEDFRNKLGIHNPIKFRYSSEIYWVKNPDPELKDRTNCHMVVVARTENGIRQLNYLISEANEHGYYFRPRVGLDQILKLDPKDVYITSACIAGHKYEDSDDIWLRIADHFGDSFFFEYQAHKTEKQKWLNAHLYDLSQAHGINTIIGLDTHYINDEDCVKRDNYLKRHGIHYEDEEGWYMDYPTGKELYQRMLDQNVLPKDEIIQAMMNTHVFRDGCEEFDYDTGFKIPILNEYKQLSYDERANELKKLLLNKYATEPKSEERKVGIDYEFGQIKDSQTADYFLDNYRIIKNAIDNHGGQLTTTSRGSAASYYCSKLCGFTTIDRFNVEVPIYPERFITKERILSAHQMPDIDFNVVSQEPFRDSAREIFGEYSCYPLLAVGTLKEKSAFKLYAGVKGIDPQVANDITTQIDNYNEALKNADDDEKDSIDIHTYITDPKHYQIYKESISYQSIIDQAKVHACGFGLFNGNPRHKDVVGYGDLRYEIGLIRCHSKSTGNTTVVLNIEGGLLDSLGFVKDDFLIVDVVGLINEFYASIGQKVPTFSEMKELVKNDKATWDIYANGATCCINQVEKPGSTMKVMKYKPHNIAELSMFIAAIRPGFASLIDNFLARKYYTTGQKEIDQVLNDTNHYMIYQESIMKVLGYLGLPMSDTYGVIKSISKKKLKGEKKEKLLGELKESWRDKFGDVRKFDNVWKVISDSASYSFNCLAGDSRIKRSSPSPNGWSPTIEEMYLIKNDVEYAKKTGHIDLHKKYKLSGYGYGLSMKDGRIWQNKIIDIYKQPNANVFKVTTESGRSVRATANHKFPTKDGIKILSELKIGDVLYYKGRNKGLDNGCLAIEDPIISIEPDGVETVYDVEMSGEVAHNFVINDGLVVCNCSHAYSMAGDSLYSAYFKAHYPDKFYEVAMNHYHKKNNKNKIFDLESEAKKFYGYTVAPMRYGQNNVKFSVDGDKKAIYSPLDSIKDIGTNAAEDMAKISDQHYKSFIDVIANCKGTKVNSKVIGKLLDVDYFEQFGKSKQLWEEYDLIKKFYGKKQLSKAEYNLDELIANSGDSIVTDLTKSGKRSDKRYQIIDTVSFIKYLSKSIAADDFPVNEKIKRQYEALGFTDVIDPSLDWHFAVVTNINDKYTVKVDLYCVNNGKSETFKIRKNKGRDFDIKTTWKQLPLEPFSMIHINGCKKQRKLIKQGDKYIPSDEYEWILTDYSLVS